MFLQLLGLPHAFILVPDIYIDIYLYLYIYLLFKYCWSILSYYIQYYHVSMLFELVQLPHSISRLHMYETKSLKAIDV